MDNKENSQPKHSKTLATIGILSAMGDNPYKEYSIFDTNKTHPSNSKGMKEFLDKKYR